MSTRTKDYPIYTYDEPAVYKDFTGGINTDPSNEHLLDNELRDCVNMTYLSGALVKRKGAKKLCEISCEDTLKNVQGIFLFTYRLTYLIIAADGKLYKGIYNENSKIELSRLYIRKQKRDSFFMFDEDDVFAGIEEKQTNEIIKNTNHEGFIQTFYRNIETNVRYEKNNKGSFYAVSRSEQIYEGELYEDNGSKFLCLKSFKKNYEFPDELNSWELMGTEFTHTYDGITTVLNGNEPDIENKVKAISLTSGLQVFDINNTSAWNYGDLCYYDHKFYHCINSHTNRYNAIYDKTLFADVSSTASNFIEEEYLLFQNHRPVEAATLNNKLYIATGTRIIEVYMFNNELMARPIEPYMCNNTEITKIGYNYMSPYPELAVASQKDTVTTDISGVKVKKKIDGTFLLTPIMNIQMGDSASNYFYRWEKNIDGTWYVIIPFYVQKSVLPAEDGAIPIQKKDYSSIVVDDADRYVYRCTFAKSFQTEDIAVQEWNSESDYSYGDYVSVGAHIYKCLKTYNKVEQNIEYVNDVFDIYARKYNDDKTEYENVLLWDEVFKLQMFPAIKKQFNTTTNTFDYITSTTPDYIVEEASGEYFRAAVSVLFNNDLGINDDFLTIHSCTKVIADGNKLLFYSDRYNSGMWFKTIINNPGYVTDRGCLSFKTTKNESVLKVVPFQGNIIVFANSDNVGGSIHLVSGNGDDYDDQSGYYSPYQRKTINASITSSNANSIQICDNIIVFKYFNRVYYINASDLNNDTVKVTPCNDRVLNDEGDVKIPWDDDDCISEVTNTYYSLLWKEKYSIDDNGELYKVRSGMRVKMYYKMSVQYSDNNYGMPWLRDESFIFNAKFIMYVKGKPIYLYNNLLLCLDDNYYKDLNEDIECLIHFKAVDLNYESFFKLVENCLVSFHRNQYNNIDLNVIIKNEAGHILLDSKSKRYAANDLGSLFAGKKYEGGELSRIGRTIQDSKMFISVNMFPCLMVDTVITAKTNGSFTLSGLTYMYTSIDSPDTNPTEIYNKIIRPKED